MRALHVVVADPSALLRAGARSSLEREGEFEVAEAGTLSELLVAARDAELAVVDLNLPPKGGIAAVEALTARERITPILWSLDPSGEAVLAGFLAGASGFLRKDLAAADLAEALRRAQREMAILAEGLAGRLAEALRRRGAAERAGERAALLSERERTVLELIAKGRRNAEIAQALGISELTVKRHVQNILHKLEVATRREAAALWATLTPTLPVRGAA